MEIGFSAIWNREPQKQPWMPSSVSFWLYKLVGKSYLSGRGEHRSGWQLSPWFAQLQQPNGLEPELQLHGRSFSHKDFTAEKTPYTGPFILKFFWTSANAFGNSPSKLLNLKAANFTGVLPSSLGNLTNLTEIHLGLANFTPTAGPSRFTNLKVLDLSSSNFTEGPIP
jgi:hypothetical protein